MVRPHSRHSRARRRTGRGVHTSPPALETEGEEGAGPEPGRKGPPQLTDTRAAETERVLRERLSELGPEAPEGRTLSRGAAVRLQGTGLLAPGQRPGREHPWGPAISTSPDRPHPVHRHQGLHSGACPAAGRVGRPPGGHCVVRYGH